MTRPWRRVRPCQAQGIARVRHGPAGASCQERTTDLLASCQDYKSCWYHVKSIRPFSITSRAYDLLASCQGHMTFWHHVKSIRPFGIASRAPCASFSWKRRMCQGHWIFWHHVGSIGWDQLLGFICGRGCADKDWEQGHSFFFAGIWQSKFEFSRKAAYIESTA